MYELKEIDSAPAVELGPVPTDLIELEAVCNGPIRPSVVDAAFKHKFSISECYLPPTKISYQLKFQGQADDVDEIANYSETTRTLSTKGKVALLKQNGPMVVHILVDGLPLIGEKYIFVYATAPNGLLKARYDKDENQVQLSLENCPPNGSFQNLTVTLASKLLLSDFEPCYQCIFFPKCKHVWHYIATRGLGNVRLHTMFRSCSTTILT